jgi:hypothetical protein
MCDISTALEDEIKVKVKVKCYFFIKNYSFHNCLNSCIADKCQYSDTVNPRVWIVRGIISTELMLWKYTFFDIKQKRDHVIKSLHACLLLSDYNQK